MDGRQVTRLRDLVIEAQLPASERERLEHSLRLVHEVKSSPSLRDVVGHHRTRDGGGVGQAPRTPAPASTSSGPPPGGAWGISRSRRALRSRERHRFDLRPDGARAVFTLPRERGV